MIRHTAWIVAATLGAISLTACQRSAQQEREKVQAAQNEGAQKVDEAKKESTTRITSAQAEVDKKVAEANADFAKMRDDYRDKLKKDLADVDKKIDRLERRAGAATDHAKNDLDSALPDIRAKREILQDDLRQIDQATMSNWDALEKRVESDRAALDTAIDKAPSTTRYPVDRPPILP